MKKIYLIAFASLFTVVFSSCQKDELQTLGVNHQHDSDPAEKVADTDPIQSDDVTSEDSKVVDINEIPISVKEVSDGDDESDDDEIKVTD